MVCGAGQQAAGENRPGESSGSRFVGPALPVGPRQACWRGGGRRRTIEEKLIWPYGRRMRLAAIRSLARRLHDGVLDERGRPYLDFVERVADRVAGLGGGRSEVATALLLG